MFDPATMRKRFHDLGAQRAEIIAKAKPVRDKYEAMRAQEAALRDAMQPVIAQMKAAEAPLYDIDMERGMIAKALNGKTGEPG
jgi:hypothetical protein